MDQLKVDAKTLLETFGKLYARNYGVSTLEHVRREMQAARETAQPKLQRRDWSSVEREDLRSFSVFVKEGRGLGGFSGWTEAFIVERQDYSIDIFANKTKYEQKEKALTTIRVAGYQLIPTGQVKDHFINEMQPLAQKLGLSANEVSAHAADLSDDSWALAHRQRISYVFKLGGEVSSDCCGCFAMCCPSSKVTPVDIPDNNNNTVATKTEPGENTSGEITETAIAVGFMRDCLSEVVARNIGTVLGDAFERTCQDIPEKITNLAGWKDDGAEDEILTDMVLEALLPTVRDATVGRTKGPSNVRIKLWYATQKGAFELIQKLVSVAWTGMQTAMKAVQERIEPVIRNLMEMILTVISTLETKIKELVMQPIRSLLEREVAPAIQPFAKRFGKPFTESFAIARSMMIEQIKLEELPSDNAERNRMLDRIPRRIENAEHLCLPLKNTLDRKLAKLKTKFPGLFADVDFDKIQSRARRALLELVDSTLYTLELRLDKLPESERKNKAIVDEILLDYDHDIMVFRAKFVLDAAVRVFVAIFKKITSTITTPIYEKLNAAIPPKMQEFLNVERAVDGVLARIIETAIEPIVQQLYPLPQSSQVSTTTTTKT